MPAQVVGRFAPSPTGPLHFGSLVAAVGSYYLARKEGGLWLLRMEDLDAPRVVPGAADDIMRTLDACGLHWDGDIVWQSQRGDAYQRALDKLRESGRLFACSCSRKEVIASAPHAGEEGPVYAGTCRRGLLPGRKPRSFRLQVPEDLVCFTDGVYGSVQQVLSRSVGDFVLRRADGLFAYQLAVVVDDSDSGVTQVVRGADLLLSTPRQIYLHACLGTASPTYYHLPLAVDAQGEKISKRHGPISVRHKALGCGLLQEVLRFLGQSVPKELALAPAHEVLRWAECCFDQHKIPANLNGLYVNVEKFV